MKVIVKVISRIERILIKSINNFSVRLYMKCYNKWLRKNGVRIAPYTGVGYLDPSVYFDGSWMSNISIGDAVVISKDVILLVHDYSIGHAMNWINSDNQKYRFEFIKNISIGNNVFIGARSVVLPGSRIGDNVIIAAGSIVKGCVECDSVYGGVPARRLCSMEEFIKKHIKECDYVRYEARR